MIVPMQKVMIAANAAQREEFLTALRELGLVHLIPVNAEAATPDEQTRHALENANRAVGVLSMVTSLCDTPAPRGSADELIHHTLHLHRTHADKLNRLTTLQRLVEQLGDWGDVRLDDLEALDAQDLPTSYAWVSAETVADVIAPFSAVLTRKPFSIRYFCSNWRRRRSSSTIRMFLFFKFRKLTPSPLLALP